MSTKRRIGAYENVPNGRRLMGNEPLVFHCNHYNYWLQKTLLLNDALEMGTVIVSAAENSAHSLLSTVCDSLGAQTPKERLAVARDTFAELGFGTIDFSAVDGEGGRVVTPTSHYGQAFFAAASAPFSREQNLLDQGFAAAAVAVAHRLPSGSFIPKATACRSLGAPQGVIELAPGELARYGSPGAGAHWDGSVVPSYPGTDVDEPAIMQAVAGLDLSGNEEGLIPRFDVVLTNHMANFYNRISFEFVRKMQGSGMLDEAEELLINAGYHCAFHTFGGIMSSAEWDAVVAPQLGSRESWIHGLIAVVNCLGWGTWRVVELTPDKLVVRVYDDYEASGYLALYGESSRPVSFLAMGGVAGLMNLVYVGNIHERPHRDAAFFERVFEAPDSFHPVSLRSFAVEGDYSEIVAQR